MRQKRVLSSSQRLVYSLSEYAHEAVRTIPRSHEDLTRDGQDIVGLI
jgi:hypothetical protein